MLFDDYRPNPIFGINSLILVLVVPNRSADSGISMYPSFSYIFLSSASNCDSDFKFLTLLICFDNCLLLIQI